MNGVCGIV